MMDREVRDLIASEIAMMAMKSESTLCNESIQRVRPRLSAYDACYMYTSLLCRVERCAH